ncbi:arylsulfatase precursor [Fusarium denticulatum]|uniref:Arylsulfatase n=1 Tax=Fusarium denticulatum TaxID=48507 RepID=A0A8H5WU70_9HYPO|nr:arylsulfatase precursor [Fusarium denticulatum]
MEKLLFGDLEALVIPTAMAELNKPNIVVIMSDDQDARLGSLQAQPFVRELPSAVLALPHEKFVYSEQDRYFLPHWLKAAGYKTECMYVADVNPGAGGGDSVGDIGKFMNGVNMATYSPKPKGWDHTDTLVHPYQYSYNNVVMSQNRKRPLFYDGYHQTDVIKVKALARLESLASSQEPFYIQIAPTAPHTLGDGPSVPCARHMWAFSNATAPRTPNFNPEDKRQSLKPADNYELNYLAINPTPESQRIIHRLNGLLLVTKSCNQEYCRNPWEVLQEDSGGSFTTLAEAMDAKYDALFAALPSVWYQKCMNYQATENERPYYPPESASLASEYRKSTDNFPFTNVVNFTRVPGSTGRMGSSVHRHVNLTTVMETTREVTDKELGYAKICRPEDCKAGGAITTDGIFDSCCPGGD